MKIHPTVLMLAWTVFAVAVPWLDTETLVVASLILAFGVWLVGMEACWRLVRRTRILLIALIALYALATPGAPLLSTWAVPTQEGMQAGLMQAWRLLLMVAALALILKSLAREQLLAGIYGILLPFKPLGVPVERIAARLWLTMQYAETGNQANSLSERWQTALAQPDVSVTSVTLELPALCLRDFAFMIGFGAILLGALLW